MIPLFFMFNENIFRNMANINKIRISGTSYDIQDLNAPGVSALTQQEYDNLPASAKTSNTFFVITDAQAGDLTNYYTKTETNTLLGGKVDTSSVVTAVTSASTDSEIPTAKAVWDVASQGGGGVDVVQTTGTSTADVMSQDAVSTQLNNKANKSAAVGGYQFGSDYAGENLKFLSISTSNVGSPIYYPKINGKYILTTNATYSKNNYNFQLVETSAITTSVTSSSTDAQVPSAKAVNDKLGGLSLVKLTQSAYDQLQTKDPNTLYVIVN